MRNIAIFASGSGTNAENIIKFFSTSKSAKVTLVLSNRREAYVLKRAEALGVRTVFFDRTDLYVNDTVLGYLVNDNIDFIVLAGFLWLIPENILKIYNRRIVNIHPALLPSYGGKGMYGEKVHQAVIANGDKESGITIHYVNSFYDEGDIIFQARCKIEPEDTPDALASKIHALEYRHFPVVIEKLIAALPGEN
ncbi:MAG TPA: phosphoribosylglycinamide formyltransferase [Bacteroidales bacterium]|jgi:phosphoribosylglycinamide formyltransferase-1|nr:phosphoribosylglycinamide formyltransferase [Bacteroidales bacterium]